MHESASSGYRSGADLYRHARPAYSPALIERFVRRFGAGSVVDLGAGTGIFTAQVDRVGVSVVAIEPVAEMRARLAAELPDVEVANGTAEAIPLADGQVDTVVAAQAFHWFTAGPALDEIHRVLRPGGHLVTVWNVRGDCDWMGEYDAIQKPYEGDTPRHATMRWRAAIEADARFRLVDDWGTDNPLVTTVDGVVARALSTSFVAALPDDERADIAERLRALLRPYGPTITFPYRSELQAWQRGERVVSK